MRKIIDLNKINPELFDLQFTITEKGEILDKLIEDKLYREEKDSFLDVHLRDFYQKEYRQLFFHLLEFELNDLYRYKKHIKENNEVEEYLKNGDITYGIYMRNLVQKFSFFINEEGTKEFLEKAIKEYSFIFIIREAMLNLLELLLIRAENIEDSILEEWVKRMQLLPDLAK